MRLLREHILASQRFDASSFKPSHPYGVLFTALTSRVFVEGLWPGHADKVHLIKVFCREHCLGGFIVSHSFILFELELDAIIVYMRFI